MNVKLTIGLILTLIVAVGIFVIAFIFDVELGKNRGETPNDSVACTLEAKICPDGSAVGRTGPKCEFTACPVGSDSLKSSLSLSLGQSGKAHNLTIKPIKVLEDSRCPKDVTCIWAGRIRIEVEILSGLGRSLNIFEEGREITTESESITLLQVLPASNSKTQIKLSDYRFIFEIKKR